MPTHSRPSLILLLSLINPSTSTALGTLSILPLTYQSSGISFSDWITILTLCIAPLLAHIIAGTPDVVTFSPHRNFSWHHRICQCNPTTIIWRYFSIADRRLRAKKWDANHLAASNTLFWTQQGWDGSEPMVEKSRKYLIKSPEGTRTAILSKSFMKTIVVTLQGAQAAYTLIGGVSRSSYFSGTLSISTIFFPLSILGLLRLCAALWLTDEFVYAEYDGCELASPSDVETVTRSEIKRKPLPNPPGSGAADEEVLDLEHESVKSGTAVQLRPYSGTGPVSYERLVNPDPVPVNSNLDFHPTTSWQARLFRFAFTLPIFGLFVLCILYALPWSPGSSSGAFVLPPTNLLVVILYLLFITVTLFTFSYYFVRDLSATTVIPCIVSTWYQIYTIFLILITIVLMIVAVIETRKAPCGIYTSWPKEYNVCPLGTSIKPNTMPLPLGLVVRSVSPSNTELLPPGEYRIVEYDGWCIGSSTGRNQYVVAKNETLSANL